MPDEGEDLKIRFNYIKSTAFRVVHVDGCLGGPTPGSGRLLTMSLFNERQAYPTIVEHTAVKDAENVFRMGGEVSREGKQGIVREIEVCAVMGLTMAKKLHLWLGAQIRDLDALPDTEAMEAAFIEQGGEHADS